ncbi:MAG TPA: hypothetical protein PK691_10130, partial [Thermomicrobiales bacterium]|nr:hypothetical protein [Thermomicrobiales bacterium]
MFLSVLVLLGIAAAILWMPYSLYRLDNLTFYLPWYEQMGQRLRDFDIPGWMPSIMSGAPFAGDPQSGWGYVPAMVIMTLVPSVLGFKLFITFHILLAAVGSYLFIRNLGMVPAAAFAGGLIYTFGNVLERTSCCTIHMQVIVWIPWAFLAIDRVLTTTNNRHRWIWAVAGGFVMSQMIAGWIGQGAYYAGLAVTAYILYRVGQLLVRQRQQTPWVRLAMAAGIALVVMGAMLPTAVLPRLAVIDRSNLASLYDDGSSTAASTGWVMHLLLERLLGPMSRIGRWYQGIPSFVLLIFAPLLFWRRKDVRFFTIYSLVILSLIVRGSPTIGIFGVLPQFATIHAHVSDRIMIVLFIGLAVCGAAVVDGLLDWKWSPPDRIRSLLILETPLILLVASAVWIRVDNGAWLPFSRFVMAG